MATRRAAGGQSPTPEKSQKKKTRLFADLAAARALARDLKRRLTFVPAGKRRQRLPVLTVGSVRRREAPAKDLDLLVVAAAPADIKGLLRSVRLEEGRPQGEGGASGLEVVSGGDRRLALVVATAAGPRAVDVFLATAAEKPYALFHYTGGRAYNVRARAQAKRRGLLLNQYGLFRAATGAPVAPRARSEKEVAAQVGLTYRPPAARAPA